MADAALESEMATNRIRGKDDDRSARSARDATDGAVGSRSLSRFEDDAADM